MSRTRLRILGSDLALLWYLFVVPPVLLLSSDGAIISSAAATLLTTTVACTALQPLLTISLDIEHDVSETFFCASQRCHAFAAT